MEHASTLVIETRGLSKSYNGVDALKSLNLQVRPHSICGFLGPNGAGKTTTIKLLLGLIRPAAGSASIFGLDTVRDSLAIRRRIGYLAQNPRFYEYMTAREILHFTARFFFKGPRAAIRARIDETLDLVGLADKADRAVKGFSGGERQRLGIAQAQINYPDLLILDEPAAALDPQGRRDVLEVMGRLRKHTTIFYSTHILGDVQRVSDSVAILNHGQLVAQGPVDELLEAHSSPIYTLVLKGDPAEAQRCLSGQAWVSSIRSGADNGRTTWEIGVTDQGVAEAQLLRLVMADEAVTVLEFRRRKLDLEEVFLGLVEGDGDGEQ